MKAALRELLDKKAIEDVVARYSRTLDWLDDEGQASCYWPDAVIDYGFYKGDAAGFLPVVMDIERASVRRWHMLAGLQIKLHSGSSASSECYGIASAAKEQGDGSLAGNMYGGRYLDEWEKRGADDTDGEWRISARTYLVDWKAPMPDQPGFEPDPELPLPTAKITEKGHPLYRNF